jgi:hypothetical protein
MVFKTICRFRYVKNDITQLVTDSKIIVYSIDA